jgi:hypothetical protein
MGSKDDEDAVIYYQMNGGRFKAASLDKLIDIITSGGEELGQYEIYT